MANKKKRTVEDIRVENLSRQKATLIAARKCLKNPQFKKYKNMALEQKEILIALMLEYTDSDPIQYAFYMKDLANTINMMTALLDKVEQDIPKNKGDQDV